MMMVAPSTLFRVARTTLGRMACEHANPVDPPHQHARECLRDEESIAADLLLRLAAAIAGGDDDVVLERLTEAQAAIDHTRG